MASLIYNSFIRDRETGAIDMDTDSFKVMFVTATYVPNKDTHTKRSDITNECVSAGYTAGGLAAVITVPAMDLTNDRLVTSLGGVTVEAALSDARYAIYYKSRGGAATADELVAAIDLGASIPPSFELAASTLTTQN